MQNFPQELVDLVLDEVARAREEEFGQELSSIADCGLVCRRWTLRSRFHLFHFLSVGPTALERFLDLAETSTSPLLAVVRSLKLFFLEGAPFTPQHLAKLQHCVNMTRIVIQICRDPESEDSDVSDDATHLPCDTFLKTHLPTFGANCRSLTRFELSSDDHVDISLSIITDILASLPAIEVFKLHGDIVICDSKIVESSLSFPSRLHALDLNVDKSLWVFLWFLALPVLPVVKSLRFSSPRNQDWMALAMYCQRAGWGIERLRLSLLLSDSSEPFAMLRHVPMLCELEVTLELATSVPDILSALTSHNLRTIDIILDDVMPDADPVLYRALDTALATPQFNKLQHFRVRKYDFDERKSFLSALPPAAKLVMPLAHARGILEYRPDHDNRESAQRTALDQG